MLFARRRSFVRLMVITYMFVRSNPSQNVASNIFVLFVMIPHTFIVNVHVHIFVIWCDCIGGSFCFCDVQLTNGFETISRPLREPNNRNWGGGWNCHGGRKIACISWHSLSGLVFLHVCVLVCVWIGSSVSRTAHRKRPVGRLGRHFSADNNTTHALCKICGRYAICGEFLPQYTYGTKSGSNEWTNVNKKTHR